MDFWKRNITVGEPLEAENLEAVKQIAALTRRYGKDCWLWTGYYMQDLNKHQLEALENVQVVIDGPFVESLKDLSLVWKGSSNQRTWVKDKAGVWHMNLDPML